MLTPGEGRITVAMPAARAPYCKHRLTLSRSSLGRLKVEIESWLPGQPDPARVEWGPLHKLAPALREKYNFTEYDMLLSLQVQNSSARLMAEASEDMGLPVSTSEMEAA